MQLSEDNVLELIKGQSRTEQALLDLSERIDKALPFLSAQHSDLEKRVRDVEKNVWTSAGGASVIGAIIGWAVTQFPALSHLFKH